MGILTNMILTRASALVTIVKTAGEALQRLKEVAPQVLVSDIGLPDEDGITLIQRVRALAADEGGTTPAVALSGHHDIALKRAALSAGFQQYLTKPASPAQLVGAVHQCAQ